MLRAQAAHELAKSASEHNRATFRRAKLKPKVKPKASAPPPAPALALTDNSGGGSSGGGASSTASSALVQSSGAARVRFFWRHETACYVIPEVPDRAGLDVMPALVPVVRVKSVDKLRAIANPTKADVAWRELLPTVVKPEHMTWIRFTDSGVHYNRFGCCFSTGDEGYDDDRLFVPMPPSVFPKAQKEWKEWDWKRVRDAAALGGASPLRVLFANEHFSLQSGDSQTGPGPAPPPASSARWHKTSPTQFGLATVAEHTRQHGVACELPVSQRDPDPFEDALRGLMEGQLAHCLDATPLYRVDLSSSNLAAALKQALPQVEAEENWRRLQQGVRGNLNNVDTSKKLSGFHSTAQTWSVQRKVIVGACASTLILYEIAAEVETRGMRTLRDKCGVDTLEGALDHLVRTLGERKLNTPKVEPEIDVSAEFEALRRARNALHAAPRDPPSMSADARKAALQRHIGICIDAAYGGGPLRRRLDESCAHLSSSRDDVRKKQWEGLREHMVEVYEGRR